MNRLTLFGVDYQLSYRFGQWTIGRATAGKGFFVPTMTVVEAPSIPEVLQKLADLAGPRLLNECVSCEFLCRYGEHDVYFCHQSLTIQVFGLRDGLEDPTVIAEMSSSPRYLPGPTVPFSGALLSGFVTYRASDRDL